MTTRILRKVFRYALVVGLLALGGYGAYYGYVSTRQARLISQARGYLAKSNTTTALLCLRHALSYNPRHLETCRAMAEVSEKIGSPAAVLWRSRVVELSPKSTPDRLALAQTAMMFRDYLSATNALEGIDQPGRNTAAYHAAAGSVSLACKQPTQAEMHFLEASRLEPTNPVPRLHLAIVRLQTSDGLALWQASRSGLNEALTWLKRLPPESQTNQPAALLVAEFQAALRDWPALQASVDDQNWAELDFVRRAFRSRALRGQELTSSALIEWTKALKAANGRKEDMIMLLRLAAQWNWLGEAEDLLWRIVNRYPGENWARVGLAKILLADGRTRSLM